MREQPQEARFRVVQNENGRQWDIVDTKRANVIVEGGFFKKLVADIACEEWNRDYA